MEHPLTPMVPEMIAKVGMLRAVAWWMQCAMECPAAIPDCHEAIEAVAKGNPNHVIMDENGEDVARAFQLVRIFDLEPFVEAQRVARPA
jgi:hypothetical protein